MTAVPEVPGNDMHGRCLMARQLSRTAVLGASGIGRFHAAWWNLAGAEVCAYLGSSPRSLETTRKKLTQLFDFQGRGYADFRELLEKESPDIVDICCPPEYHFQYAAEALDARCDVLCEKPFVYDPGLSHQQILDQTRRLTQKAQSSKRLLGMCSQYCVTAEMCRGFWERICPGEEIKTVRIHIASPGRGRGTDPIPIWVDLGPHLLSAIQCLLPDSRSAWSISDVSFAANRAHAELHMTDVKGRCVKCDLHAGRTTTKPDHIRRIEINDSLFEIEGERDADGIFGARITTDGGSVAKPDAMRVLIEQFLAGNALVTPQHILWNTKWLLRIIEQA